MNLEGSIRVVGASYELKTQKPSYGGFEPILAVARKPLDSNDAAKVLDRGYAKLR